MYILCQRGVIPEFNLYSTGCENSNDLFLLAKFSVKIVLFCILTSKRSAAVTKLSEEVWQNSGYFGRGFLGPNRWMTEMIILRIRMPSYLGMQEIKFLCVGERIIWQPRELSSTVLWPIVMKVSKSALDIIFHTFIPCRKQWRHWESISVSSCLHCPENWARWVQRMYEISII